MEHLVAPGASGHSSDVDQGGDLFATQDTLLVEDGKDGVQVHQTLDVGTASGEVAGSTV